MLRNPNVKQEWDIIITAGREGKEKKKKKKKKREMGITREKSLIRPALSEWLCHKSGFADNPSNGDVLSRLLESAFAHLFS